MIKMSKKGTEIGLVENPVASSMFKDAAYREAVLINKQIPVPWVKKTHYLDPWFLKADSKIAKYDMSGLHIWRVCYSHSLRSKLCYT